MLATNATSYTEVSFLPSCGNVSDVFEAIADKAAELTRAKGRKSDKMHKRSRSSVVSMEEDEWSEELAGIATARFPDQYAMERCSLILFILFILYVWFAHRFFYQQCHEHF